MSSDSEHELQCAGCRKHYSKKADLNWHVSQCQKYADYFKSFGPSTQAAATSFRKRRRIQQHSPSSDSDSSTGSSLSGRSHDIPAASSGDERTTAHAAGNDDSEPVSASGSTRKGSQTVLDDDSDDHVYSMSDVDDRTFPLPERTKADETVPGAFHADSDDMDADANLSDPQLSETSSIRRHRHHHGIHAPWRSGVPTQTPLQDELPEGPSGDLESDVEDDSEPEGVPMDIEPSGLRLRIALKVKTAVNRFGIWRVYGRRPTAVPDLNLPPNQLNNPKLPLRRHGRI